MTTSAFHVPIVLVALLLSGAVAAAQPHGWRCDYGYRPGTTWFYRSSFLNGRVYQLTVRRDSIDPSGAYWADVTWSWEPGNWHRFNSDCSIDRFLDPPGAGFRHWISGEAEQESIWIVENSPAKGRLNARVDTIYRRSIFGRMVDVRRIVYSYSAYGTESWYLTEEWADGFGVVESWGGVSIHDELVGAIIDGVLYGNVSGVADGIISGARDLMVYPNPTSGNATLMLTSHTARRAAITIHDLLGRLVHRELIDLLNDGVNTVPLDGAGLAPGSYHVVVDLDGVRRTAPLIVAR